MHTRSINVDKDVKNTQRGKDTESLINGAGKTDIHLQNNEIWAPTLYHSQNLGQIRLAKKEK